MASCLNFICRTSRASYERTMPKNRIDKLMPCSTGASDGAWNRDETRPALKNMQAHSSRPAAVQRQNRAEYALSSGSLARITGMASASSTTRRENRMNRWAMVSKPNSAGLSSRARMAKMMKDKPCWARLSSTAQNEPEAIPPDLFSPLFSLMPPPHSQARLVAGHGGRHEVADARGNRADIEAVRMLQRIFRQAHARRFVRFQHIAQQGDQFIVLARGKGVAILVFTDAFSDAARARANHRYTVSQCLDHDAAKRFLPLRWHHQYIEQGIDLIGLDPAHEFHVGIAEFLAQAGHISFVLAGTADQETHIAVRPHQARRVRQHVDALVRRQHAHIADYQLAVARLRHPAYDGKHGAGNHGRGGLLEITELQMLVDHETGFAKHPIDQLRQGLLAYRQNLATAALPRAIAAILEQSAAPAGQEITLDHMHHRHFVHARQQPGRHIGVFDADCHHHVRLERLDVRTQTPISAGIEVFQHMPDHLQGCGAFGKEVIPVHIRRTHDVHVHAFVLFHAVGIAHGDDTHVMSLGQQTTGDHEGAFRPAALAARRKGGTYKQNFQVSARSIKRNKWSMESTASAGGSPVLDAQIHEQA